MKKTAEESFQKGNEEFEKKNYDFALGYFCMAISADKNYHKAYFKKGLVYYEKNMPEKAIENFNSAIKIKPDYAEAYDQKGNTYLYLLKNNEEALKQFIKVIELCPENSDLKIKTYLKKTLLYLDMNKKPEMEAKVFRTRTRRRLKIHKKLKLKNSFFVKMSVMSKSNMNRAYNNTLYFHIIGIKK